MIQWFANIHIQVTSNHSFKHNDFNVRRNVLVLLSFYYYHIIFQSNFSTKNLYEFSYNILILIGIFKKSFFIFLVISLRWGNPGIKSGTREYLRNNT